MASRKNALDTVVAEVAVITFGQRAVRRSVIDALTMLCDRLFALQESVTNGLVPAMACQLAALHILEAASRLNAQCDGLLGLPPVQLTSVM
jgi:hypothetical protein